MNTEVAYTLEKFVDIEVLENFVPLLNKRGQAKLAFVEALPGLVETKDGEELAKIQFRFICEGANGSQVISYTGWLKEALSELSKLGQILKGFKIVEFDTPKAVAVDEFDFTDNFKPSTNPQKRFKLEGVLSELAKLEGTIVLAKLTCDQGIWHRPDPTTFDFPVDKKGNFYRVDVSEFKVK